MHRLDNIQALRGVAVLLVVARHLQLFAARAIGGEPALGLFLAGDMGVDLFFVISGFIMVAVHRHTPAARAPEAADFLYRRVSRIYPLYWFYSLPVLAVYVWRPDWLHRFSFGMGIHPLSSFLLWPQRDWPLLGQAWSLVYEMYFYVVFAGLLLLPGRLFSRGLLAWAGIVLAGHALLPTLPALDGAVARSLFSLFALEFIGGALVGLAVHRWRELPAHWGWLLIGFGAVWFVGAVMPLDEHLSAGERVFLYGLPAAALVYGAVVLEHHGARTPRLLTLVGDWSYSVYLSHIFVIATLARVVPSAWTHRPPTEVLATSVCLTAVLLCGAASYYFLERPLLRLTRRWLF